MDLEQHAAEVLETVSNAGAEGDLIIDESQSLSLKARDGELEEHKVSSTRVFGLRVIRDDRVGTAYSEASDRDALQSMVQQALINASFAKVEPEEKILSTNGELCTDDTLLCPVDKTSVDEKIRFSLAMERELAAKSKVRNVPHNNVHDSQAQKHLYTSAGLKAHSKQNACIAVAFALMEEDDINIMDGFGRAARRFGELDHLEIVEEAHKRCLGLLHGKPIPGKHYDVIFDEECQTDLFHSFTMMLFSGQAARDGVNPMRDKVGEMVADPRLSIIDQPLLTEGFGYALFDSEGTPTRETPLIQEGRLETLAHNSATAAHFGVRTTGHAWRGSRSRLGVNLHQLQVLEGDDDHATLLSGEYIEITDLAGLHSGANAVSGQFSFGAAGYLCNNGQRVQPVRNITVAGNFYQMLQKISAIGDECFWNIERTALMPHIRFADMAISG